MSKTIAAIFDDHTNAEGAARQIKDRGLKTSDISIVTKQKDEGNEDNSFTMGLGNLMGGMGANDPAGMDEGENVNDNISGGVMTGGILGGLAGLLIGAGSMVIPGLGIIAAAGPITGLLSGAVTGGIVGGLVDLGIPEDKGREYESDIKAGKTLFSMKADEEKMDEIASILRDNGAKSMDNY